MSSFMCVKKTKWKGLDLGMYTKKDLVWVFAGVCLGRRLIGASGKERQMHTECFILEFCFCSENTVVVGGEGVLCNLLVETRKDKFAEVDISFKWEL